MFREDLEHVPENGWALKGLERAWKLLEGDPGRAVRVLEEAELGAEGA